jgi:hypothetical protein
VCIPKPDGDALAGKGVLEVTGDRLAELRGDVAPLHTGRHKRGDQDSTRRNNVIDVILAIAIVAAGPSDLGVYVVTARGSVTCVSSPYKAILT